MVRDATELETNIVSAERIQEYTEIESEVQHIFLYIPQLFWQTAHSYHIIK